MIAALSIIFVVSYAAIALEHPLRVNKSAIALIGAGLMWVIFALFSGLTPHDVAHDKLGHTLIEVGQIVFFLMGAMTIVELIDIHNGFDIITKRIQTKKLSTLMFQIGIATFFLSAVLDNLATTIVMCSLLKKILGNKQDRLLFAGLIVITANAGGAWSPIGDVTTTMLWIGDKVSTPMLIKYLLIPSIACAVVAAGTASLLPVFKGKIKLNPVKDEANKYSLIMLVLGLGSIVCVPVFKIITHLPPYVGMMLALGVVSVFAEIYSNREFQLSKATGPNPEGGINESKHHESPVHNALTKIELPSILFFLGILLAVAALESLGLLFVFATILKESISLDLLMILFGFASAVIDNVPLVAASLGMFTEFAPDDQLWHFLAYCAGTGGSMLIIGSAAGVVAMGMEKITFGWYLKNILWIALVGYFAGIGVFLLMRNFIA